MRFRRSIISILFAAVMLMLAAGSASAQIGIGISVGFGPPALPVYEQPLCPGDGYLWTPGYWGWDTDASDYYWVPGTWVLAPEVGFLWTPPWWGWEGGFYHWHEGYWGPHIGFYGGINYGFGYFGNGFYGGRWDHGHFFYNREVANINVTNIHNVYNEHVDIRNNSHVSFNGGQGGINARPTREEEAAEHDRHVAPIAAQMQHVQAARGNPELRASANHGKPSIAATARPGDLHEGAVGAKEAGGEYHAPERNGANEPARGGTTGGNAVHPKELPPIDRGAPINTGDAKRDQKLQQQQDKLVAKQNAERDKLQAQQDKEHAQLAKQNANEQRKAQVEQKHSQQTQALQQRHTQQMQSFQSHAAPSHGGGRPK